MSKVSVVRSEVAHGTTASYTIGFVLSMALTVAAFWTVAHKASFSKQSVIVTVIGLAIAQLLVQLYFFLHLGRESRPRWNLMVFLFMLLVLLIVVFGSLWIMNNLDYNMMHTSPDDTNEHIMEEENIYR